MFETMWVFIWCVRKLFLENAYIIEYINIIPNFIASWFTYIPCVEKFLHRTNCINNEWMFSLLGSYILYKFHKIKQNGTFNNIWMHFSAHVNKGMKSKQRNFSKISGLYDYIFQIHLTYNKVLVKNYWSID